MWSGKVKILYLKSFFDIKDRVVYVHEKYEENCVNTQNPNKK